MRQLATFASHEIASDEFRDTLVMTVEALTKLVQQQVTNSLTQEGELLVLRFDEVGRKMKGSHFLTLSLHFRHKKSKG